RIRIIGYGIVYTKLNIFDEYQWFLRSIEILGIDSARHKLIAIRRQEGIEEVKRKGIIIDREVSPYEVPLNPHGLIQAKLISIMDNWSVQLQVIGELDVIVGTRSIYRSDISVQPRNRRQPQPSQAVNSSRKPYPTLVVEIASTESLRSLHELTTTYFSQQTTIQILFSHQVIPTAFGGVPCDDTNLQEYQMAIPTTFLFNDVPGGVPDSFIVDLWRLQDAILIRCILYIIIKPHFN
ncbi:13639_t:CDS:2, partial [Entrophospora sp. SA101]